MGKILIYNSRQKDKKISSIISMQDNPREAALLAYMAGIFDGEGTVGIKKYLPKGKQRSVNYFLYLTMGMTFREVPELFKNVFGGSLSEERVLRKRLMWRWNATGKTHIAVILGALIPYLRVKREQALLALKCINEWTQIKNGKLFTQLTEEELLNREEAYLLMRKLKIEEHPQRLNELTRESVKR
jgi:hypothetical protein